jgi:hypothetical protein
VVRIRWRELRLKRDPTDLSFYLYIAARMLLPAVTSAILIAYVEVFVNLCRLRQTGDRYPVYNSSFVCIISVA